MWRQNPLYMEVSEVENFADVPEVDDEPEKPAPFVPEYDPTKDDDSSPFEEPEGYDDTVYLLNSSPK